MNHRATILVIEDDEDIRETIQQVLEAEGYAVDTAANGREALDSLRDGRARPCVILLDLMMPVMSGPEFLMEMRGDQALAPIPVVVVSAWPGEAEIEAAETQGFVRKPIDLEQLLAQLDRYC